MRWIASKTWAAAVRVLVAVFFITYHTLGFLRTLAAAAGDYLWTVGKLGSEKDSPFGFLRAMSKPDREIKAPTHGGLRAIDGGKKTMRDVGCKVEPGWEVIEVQKADGLRVEANKAGTRRLVHSGTGQVIVGDLDDGQVRSNA